MKTSQTPWYQKHGLTHHRTWYLKNREKVLAKRKEKYRKLSSDPNYRTLINLKRKHLKEKYRAFAITIMGEPVSVATKKCRNFYVSIILTAKEGKNGKVFCAVDLWEFG